MINKIKINRNKLLIIIGILIIFVSFTLAYVIDQLMHGATGDVSVISDTVDNLEFYIDKDISLNPNQFNVTEGGGGLSDTAVGTASLIANSINNESTYNYYVYFKINTNEYIYTTEDNKPELVLTITDPNGNLVTSVTNLNYVEVTNADGTAVSGFDITTGLGDYYIVQNQLISTNREVEQVWNVDVTFVNLASDQGANMGKTFNGTLRVEMAS